MVSEGDSVTVIYTNGNGKTVEKTGLTVLENKSFSLRPDRITLGVDGEPAYTVEESKIEDKTTGRVVGVVESIEQSP